MGTQTSPRETPRTCGKAAEAGSLRLTIVTPGEPEAPAGHSLGAHLPPLLELHHRPTPDLGALKSRVALSPPDLVFFWVLFLLIFKNKFWNQCISNLWEQRGSGREGSRPRSPWLWNSQCSHNPTKEHDPQEGNGFEQDYGVEGGRGCHWMGLEGRRGRLPSHLCIPAEGCRDLLAPRDQVHRPG